jgi:hypothetical protein
VFVHFHDVTIPYDYMPDLLSGDLFSGQKACWYTLFSLITRALKSVGCAMVHGAALE